jgi:protein YIPF1/2
VPTTLYLLMKWRKCVNEFTLLELLCIYGYSLSAFVPVCILWIIKISLVQWILVITAVTLSGSVLVLTFWPTFSQEQSKKVNMMTYMLLLLFFYFLLKKKNLFKKKNKVTIVIMSMIFLLHALLGIGFMVSTSAT